MFNYVSCGRLGDFIDELSVVNEIFLKTGRKGNIYISRDCNYWSESIESTFEYIKDILLEQDYINDFKVYAGENIDINLSLWRNHIYCRGGVYVPSHTIPQIISSMYQIQWASHPWMEIDSIDPKWATTTFINATSYRPIVCEVPDKDVYFIGIIDEHYEHFKKTNNVDIPLYKPKNFRDLCICLKSCKMFIGGMSMYCSLARSIGTKCIIGKHTKDTSNEIGVLFPDLDKFMNYVTYL